MVPHDLWRRKKRIRLIQDIVLRAPPQDELLRVSIEGVAVGRRRYMTVPSDKVPKLDKLGLAQKFVVQFLVNVCRNHYSRARTRRNPVLEEDLSEPGREVRTESSAVFLYSAASVYQPSPSIDPSKSERTCCSKS